MKRNFYVSAIYTSPPNTMGGNTKIMLELINHLSDKYHFVIFTTEPETFKKHIKKVSKIEIIPIKYPFNKFSYFSHHKEIQYISDIYQRYFKKNKITKSDYFYSCSDFAPDVLPISNLKKSHSFTWIASLYLFIPNPVVNLVNNYKFPFAKYIIYFIYQKYLFRQMLRFADLFFITNDFDKKYFPKRFQDKLLAIYGGVNTDQIPENSGNSKKSKQYDAIFCSRLHPQKGISQLIEIWRMVVDKIPSAKLAVMGDGEKSFEAQLKLKTKELGLEKNIIWLGFVDNIAKYENYSKSKMLIHGTIYDNNGMVAAEALATGLPVVLYDLPQLRNVYTEGCVKVPVRNKKVFSQKIIKLITDDKYYNSVKPNNQTVSRLRHLWGWENRAALTLDFLRRYEMEKG